MNPKTGENHQRNASISGPWMFTSGKRRTLYFAPILQKRIRKRPALNQIDGALAENRFGPYAGDIGKCGEGKR